MLIHHMVWWPFTVKINVALRKHICQKIGSERFKLILTKIKQLTVYTLTSVSGSRQGTRFTGGGGGDVESLGILTLTSVSGSRQGTRFTGGGMWNPSVYSHWRLSSSRQGTRFVESLGILTLTSVSGSRQGTRLASSSLRGNVRSNSSVSLSSQGCRLAGYFPHTVPMSLWYNFPSWTQQNHLQ